MSAYSDLVLAHANLAVYYRLGESSGTTLTDSGPNSLNGTLAGSGITYSVTGALANDANTALTFDATSNPATVTDPGTSSAIDLVDGPFSIEFWVKRTGSGLQLIVDKGATASDPAQGAYQVRITAANRIALTRAQNAGNLIQSSVIDTNWHHVVVTKDGSARNIYVDGILDNAIVGTNQTLTDSTSNLEIGHLAGTARLAGSLDEIAIYKAVLSASEVWQHYKVGKGLIDQATETDSVTSLSSSKAKDIAEATATDLAQAIDKAKEKATAQATETDESSVLSVDKAKATGQAAETDEAQPIAAGELYPVTQPTETDLALPLAVDKAVALGQATETDAAQSIGVPQSIAVGQAQETDDALAITVQGASTSGAVRFAPRMFPEPPRPPKRVDVFAAHELDSALPMAVLQTPSRIQIEDDELLLLV